MENNPVVCFHHLASSTLAWSRAISALLMIVSCVDRCLTLGLGTLVVNTCCFSLPVWLGTVIKFWLHNTEKPLLVCHSACADCQRGQFHLSRYLGTHPKRNNSVSKNRELLNGVPGFFVMKRFIQPAARNAEVVVARVAYPNAALCATAIPEGSPNPLMRWGVAPAAQNGQPGHSQTG